MAQESEAKLTDHVYKLLKDKEASRIVIGHTPTPGAIITRFNGKVVMIDAGMSDYFGSRRACLTIEGDKLYAIHRGARVPLPGAGPVDYIRYLRAVIALEPSPGLLNSFLRNFESHPGQNP